ncbi:MAG: hypothetical protein WC208_14420 [Gallionella sp.]|jgi:hypothetical protein
MYTTPAKILHMPTRHSPDHNHLLAALPPDIFKRIAPELELVEMPLGTVLFEYGCQLQHVYFPTNAVASLHYITENGASTEIAGVGNEGVLGVSVIMGCKTTSCRAAVCSGGHGYRMKAHLIMEEFNRAGPMMRLMLHYTQALTGC